MAPGKNRGEWAVDSSTCMSCELLSCEPAEIDCGEGGELIGDVERGTCSCLPAGAGGQPRYLKIFQCKTKNIL